MTREAGSSRQAPVLPPLASNLGDFDDIPLVQMPRNASVTEDLSRDTVTSIENAKAAHVERTDSP
jgi:hypothetical protein